jgi:hypothetical protein
METDPVSKMLSLLVLRILDDGQCPKTLSEPFRINLFLFLLQLQIKERPSARSTSSYKMVVATRLM